MVIYKQQRNTACRFVDAYVNSDALRCTFFDIWCESEKLRYFECI